jgi:hypothetical protein
MARLDRAIHENFNVLVDGRVKPGHDNEGSRRFLHTRMRGNDDPESVTSNILATHFNCITRSKAGIQLHIMANQRA